jgi:meso-butanediol dehydrogenase / (S,S)-butanediol dehydrogenase / diacetyl reductase
MSLPDTLLESQRRPRFDGKVAIVTGSGRGIGFEVARILLSEGASVVINDLNSDRLAAASGRLDAVSDRLRSSTADVTVPGAVEELMSLAVEEFGHLDVLVNVVGGSYGAPHMRLMDFSREDWYHIVDLNLTSVFLCMKAAVPHLRKNMGGAIVNVSSSAGVRGEPGLWSPIYCSAKAGVQGLTRQAALEFGHSGIRVNCVAQGDVLSERTYEYLTGKEPGYFEDVEAAKVRYEKYPIPRMGEPIEVANVICFLASPDASYVTGETVLITGGSYLAP